MRRYKAFVNDPEIIGCSEDPTTSAVALASGRRVIRPTNAPATRATEETTSQVLLAPQTAFDLR